MLSNYGDIIPNFNLFALKKSELSLYFYLLGITKWTDCDSFPLNPTNSELGKSLSKDPDTISRYIKGLKNKGLIEVKYTPTKFGVQRLIFIKRTVMPHHEN